MKDKKSVDGYVSPDEVRDFLTSVLLEHAASGEAANIIKILSSKLTIKELNEATKTVIDTSETKCDDCGKKKGKKAKRNKRATMTLMLPVVFDETRESPEQIAGHFDYLLSVMRSLIGGRRLKKHGIRDWQEFYVSTHNPEHPHVLDAVYDIDDTATADGEKADIGPVLQMHVTEESTGILVKATRNGVDVGSVLLDYFSNKLVARVYTPDEDGPVVNSVISENVQAIATTKKLKKEKKRGRSKR